MNASSDFHSLQTRARVVFDSQTNGVVSSDSTSVRKSTGIDQAQLPAGNKVMAGFVQAFTNKRLLCKATVQAHSSSQLSLGLECQQSQRLALALGLKTRSLSGNYII